MDGLAQSCALSSRAPLVPFLKQRSVFTQVNLLTWTEVSHISKETLRSKASPQAIYYTFPRVNRAGGHPEKAAINCLQGALSSSTNKVCTAVFIHRRWVGGGGLQGCCLLRSSHLVYIQLMHTNQQNTCCTKRSGSWHSFAGLNGAAHGNP